MNALDIQMMNEDDFAIVRECWTTRHQASALL